MRIVNITSKTSAYVIIRNLSIKPGGTGSIDVDILILSELKSIRNLSLAHDIEISTNDFNYITDKIASMSGGTGGGGDAPVKSVNTEIGDVVLDASKIKVADGDTIEEEFSQLSPVAYSGSYLDLSNRPGGTGEPFTVIDWNPYVEQGVEKQFIPANSSTSYANGVITRQALPSIQTSLIDIGQPNSPNIVVNNGSNGTPTTITINVAGTDPYAKTMALGEWDSVLIKPVTTGISHNGSQKGAFFSFFIFQLEPGEDPATMPINDIMAKTHNISVNLQDLYLNEYNSYSSMNYGIMANGSSVAGESLNINGNYDVTGFTIKDNHFIMGGGFADVDLVQLGFDPVKEYGAVFIAQVSNPSAFDNTTPFSFELSGIKASPEVTNEYPDVAEIVVKADAELVFGFDNLEMNDYFALNVNKGFDDFSFMCPETGQTTLTDDYIDSNGNVTLRIEDSHFKIKNHTANVWFNAYTAVYPPFTVQVLTRSDAYGNTSKNTWNFTVNTWSKIEVLNGTLPANSIDGSTIRVTHSGKFNDMDLLVNDIVNPYDNKTKIILHRNGQQVSNNVNTAGSLPVSGDAVKAYAATADTLAGTSLYVQSNKLEVKVDPNPDNLISNGVNGLSGKLPDVIVPNVLREASEIFNYQSNIQLSLSSKNVFVINSPGSTVYTYFTNLTDFDLNDFNRAVSKTITIIIVDAVSITWPYEIIWADGTAPTIEPNQYLVVNGIHVRSGNSEPTNGKVLCTYSYFNR